MRDDVIRVLKDIRTNIELVLSLLLEPTSLYASSTDASETQHPEKTRTGETPPTPPYTDLIPVQGSPAVGGERGKSKKSGTNIADGVSRQALKFCPAEMELTPTRQYWAKQAGLVSKNQIEREWALFRDHEFKVKKTDWNRTWRNWCRRAAGDGRVQPVPNVQPPSAEETRTSLEKLGLLVPFKKIPEP